MKSAAASMRTKGAAWRFCPALCLCILLSLSGVERAGLCRSGVETPALSVSPSPSFAGLLGDATRVTNNLEARAPATTGGRAGTKPGAETPSPKLPWGRIVLVGASASAGFTESEPFGGPDSRQYRLSRYIDAAVVAPHEPVQNFANSMFFLQPEAEGRRQIGQAVRSKPTLVVGLDFLFWFCYGDGASDEDRLKRFEQGLGLLAGIPCSLIVGDIPDASAAVDSALSPEQVPSAKAIAAANRRLKEWAASHRRVVVLPLSKFMSTVIANQALTIHGRTFAAGKTQSLLQSDKLHPSALGCAVLTVSLLDAFAASQPALSTGDVRWDPREILRLGSQPSSGNRPVQAKPAVPSGKGESRPGT